MPTPAESLMAAQGALIGHAQDLARRQLDTFGRLCDLQRETSQRVMSARPTANGGFTPDFAQMAQAATDYQTRLAELLWSGHAETLRLLQDQAAQMQSLAGEMLAGGLRAAATLRPHGATASQSGAEGQPRP